MTADSVTFASGATRLSLYHSYGREQETAQQYFHKVLVDTDPRTRFATFPAKAQEAINDGRVERGMTREQVLMSLGYPPTHRTATTDLTVWTYWYNRWATYTVSFGADGRVQAISGPAPTHNDPVPEPTPPPTPAPARRRR
jgi:hypothetical protein